MSPMADGSGQLPGTLSPGASGLASCRHLAWVSIVKNLQLLGSPGTSLTEDFP